jgi:NADP-dependent 3-hydroxy acid dehydrogenase YdfG
MKQQNFGKIITIASDADRLSFAGAGAYCASKAGARLLADCIRKEVAGYNISVTVISPGRVDTHFNGKQPGDRPHSLAAADVARQVQFVLAQPERCEIESINLNSALEKELH